MAELAEEQKEEGWALLAKNNRKPIERATRNFDGKFHQDKRRAVKPKAKTKRS